MKLDCWPLSTFDPLPQSITVLGESSSWEEENPAKGKGETVRLCVGYGQGKWISLPLEGLLLMRSTRGWINTWKLFFNVRKGIKNHRPPVFSFFLGTLTLVLRGALLGSYVHYATRGCKHWLSEFLLLFYYLQPVCIFWPLTPEIDKALSSLHLLFTELDFLCLEAFCVNPKRWLSCGENPSRSSARLALNCCQMIGWLAICVKEKKKKAFEHFTIGLWKYIPAVNRGLFWID